MREEEMVFARQDPESMAGAETQVEEQVEKFLIFKSDGLDLGASVEYVVEIITSHMVTRLPMVPDYVSGIINLRGQIIPIIDVRLRLGKPPREDCCVVVLEVDGTQFGIQVDSVAQMVDIPRDRVLPMPAHHRQRMISGMCSLPEGGTMLILDCALLLAD